MSDQTFRDEQILALQEFSMAAHSAGKLEDILSLACQAAVKIFDDVDHSGVVRFEPDYSMGEAIAEFPAREEFNVDIHFSIPVAKIPAESQLVKQQIPLLNIPDIEACDDLGQVKQILRVFGIKSILIVPIVVKGKVIASLSLDAIKQPRTFSPSDENLAKSLAAQVAMAIQKAQQLAALATLHETALAITSWDNETRLETILEKIVQHAVDLLKARSGGIYRYYRERQELTIIADYSRPDMGITSLKGTTIKVGEGIAGRLVKMKQPSYISVLDYNTWRKKPRVYNSKHTFGAVISVRLDVRDHILGVLYIDDNVGRDFEDDAELLTQFAAHVAIAVNKAILLHQLSHVKKVTAAVAGVATLGDGEVTLQSIADGTRDALSCDAVTLYGYDETADKLDHPPKHVGLWFPEKVAASPVGVRRDSVVFSILKSGKLEIVTNVNKDDRFRDTQFAKREEIQSCVAITLFVRLEKQLETVSQKKVGIMFVNYRTPHTFSPDELENISMFANLAAVAIHNVQKFRQEQRQTKVSEALVGANRAISSSLDLKETLQHIAEQAHQVISTQVNPVSFANIRLVNDNTSKLVAAYPRQVLFDIAGQIGDEIDLKRRNGKIGILGQAIRTKKPLRAGNVEDRKYRRYYLKIHPETKSELAVPILFKGEAIGGINVEHTEYDAFDEYDEKTLLALADQAAIAIENARSYERARNLEGQLSRIADLKTSYEDARGQANTNYKVSLVVAILGILIIFFAVILALQGAREVAIASAIGGVITESIGFLFYTRVDRANIRMDDNHNARLAEAHNLKNLLSECDNLSTVESREECRKQLIAAAQARWFVTRSAATEAKD